MIDALSLTFSALITGIGLLILIYAQRYMEGEKNLGFFYSTFLIFFAAMLGVVLSPHLLMLFFFWELTSMSSFLLIGFWTHKSAARQGAFKAFFITSAGGLGLLASFLMLGHVAGTYDIPTILERRELILTHPWLPWILSTFLFAAFTKSAQWPFHIWLPHAMEAPTPVSAFLHAATMVKAGIFLLARFYPLFGDTDLWRFGVTGIGLITLVWGSVQALKQHDLKAILAYSTISQLGLLTSLYGAGHWIGVSMNLFHIATHACYKGSLFMVVGIIDHAAGTRDIRRLSGLYSILPITGIVMALAALSMSSVPPFLGFMSKEMVLESGMAFGRSTGWGWIHPLAVSLCAALTVVYSLKIVHGVFWGRPLPSDLKSLHHPPASMLFPPAVLAIGGLLCGVWALGAYWHGVTAALGLSAVALGLGFFLYKKQTVIDRWLHHRHAPWTFHQGYESVMNAIVPWSAQITRTTTPSTIAGAVVLFLTLIGAAALWAQWALPNSNTPRIASPDVSVLTLSILGFTAASTLALIAVRDRVAQVILLGVVGFMVTFLFVLQGAPDLALTQFLVESVMLILFVLALKRIPEAVHAWRRGWSRVGAWGFSILCGLGFGGLAWALLGTRPSSSVTEFFIENSKQLAGGQNIVNVILVDFRGYDTLGEITVVVMAGLGVYSLLKKRVSE